MAAVARAPEKELYPIYLVGCVLSRQLAVEFTQTVAWHVQYDTWKPRPSPSQAVLVGDNSSVIQGDDRLVRSRGACHCRGGDQAISSSYYPWRHHYCVFCHM